MPRRSGFTLIELLITITIIAVLSAIGLVAYGTFLRNARDAKRQSDVKLIQSGLEEYFVDQRYYPTQLTPGGALTNPQSSKSYLSTTPNDPLKNPDYAYSGLPSDCNNTSSYCISYCLFARFEGSIPPVSNPCASFPSSTPAYNYGITKP